MNWTWRLKQYVRMLLQKRSTPLIHLQVVQEFNVDENYTVSDIASQSKYSQLNGKKFQILAIIL